MNIENLIVIFLSYVILFIFVFFLIDCFKKILKINQDLHDRLMAKDLQEYSNKIIINKQMDILDDNKKNIKEMIKNLSEEPLEPPLKEGERE